MVVDYYVQLSTVRLTIAKGEIVGLEQWLQANPYSGVAAINMLGWTLFLGLSSLFVAPVFFWQRFGKGHLHCFLGERCFYLLGGIGHIFEITALVFITINLGMGDERCSADGRQMSAAYHPGTSQASDTVSTLHPGISQGRCSRGR